MKPLIGIALVLAAVSSSAFAQSNDGRNSACRADVEQYCKDIQPGGGRIMKCMASHKDDLSEDCKASLKEKHAQRKDKSGGDKGAAGDQGSGDDN